MSQQATEMIKMPRELFDRFIDAVCYAGHWFRLMSCAHEQYVWTLRL
jgi:hypothetical protein